MNCIDNFELIRPLLKFPHKDIFYFIQILQRKKDHKGTALGGSNNNSRLIKAYYITSVEKLFIHREEMIKMADLFNARVSINLNPRNFQKAGFHLLQKVANQMSNGDFYNIRKAYDSICGEYHSEMDKRWLIDIDTKDHLVFDGVTSTIERLHSKIENREYSILASIPSKSGYHLITNPFNLMEFTKEHPDIEVHKNNPTNLYIPQL